VQKIKDEILSFDRKPALFIRMHIKWTEVGMYCENVQLSDV